MDSLGSDHSEGAWRVEEATYLSVDIFRRGFHLQHVSLNGSQPPATGLAPLPHGLCSAASPLSCWPTFGPKFCASASVGFGLPATTTHFCCRHNHFLGSGLAFSPDCGQHPEMGFNPGTGKGLAQIEWASTKAAAFNPVSYLLLSKPAKGVEKSFSPLSFLGISLPVCKEVVAELKAAGASWIQFDESTLVCDLDAHQLQAFPHAYTQLESSLSGLNVLIETYCADVPAEGCKTMAFHILGYPRMGPKRELKFALESFWDGKSRADDLQKVAADLRSSMWKQMAGAGIKHIPSQTFSYYDQVLDNTAMIGAVPPRYGWKGGEIGFDIYFSMARGNATLPVMEMTKWFDSNYHFVVPELGPDTKFSYASLKAMNEYKAAKGLGVVTIPVLIGPVSYLLLSKLAKGVEKSFATLSLLESNLPVYKEVVAELKAAGASWIQFDEPTLVYDLDAHQLQAFTHAYAELESSHSGLNVLIETYFPAVPAKACKAITSLNAVTGFGFDLVRGAKTPDLIKGGFASGKFPFAGVVDGRYIWANDLAASLSSLQALESIVGKDKLVAPTSFSLLHTAVDLVNETMLDAELKSWLAFAAQKVVEVNALGKALAGQKDEIHTHMCYSNFNDIIHSIIDMDADVITIENSRSDEKLLSVFHEGGKYGAGIGPGVYDIHSPRIPSTGDRGSHQQDACVETNILWVNLDCGLKTRKYPEVSLQAPNEECNMRETERLL